MGKITIDTLAGIMKTSFEHLEKKVDKLEERVDKGFGEVDEGFEEVNERLDKIGNGHERRITKLEDEMRVVKTSLGK